MTTVNNIFWCRKGIGPALSGKTFLNVAESDNELTVNEVEKFRIDLEKLILKLERGKYK